jgi:hypothetical protein
MKNMKPFPADKTKWSRSYLIREATGDLPVAILMSEPWQAEEELWHCAISITYPGQKIETWSSSDDAISAIGGALSLVRVQQRFLLDKFGEKLIWPLNMQPIKGSEFEEVALL